MRISDWSSDVCSSDLGALMQTCVCVRQGIPLNPNGLSPAPCSRMAGKGAAMASFHLAVKTIGRSAGRSATAAARSEAHTSELPSLMRISYAAFCLKKKSNDCIAPHYFNNYTERNQHYTKSTN